MIGLPFDLLDYNSASGTPVPVVVLTNTTTTVIETAKPTPELPTKNTNTINTYKMYCCWWWVLVLLTLTFFNRKQNKKRKNEST